MAYYVFSLHKLEIKSCLAFEVPSALSDISVRLGIEKDLVSIFGAITNQCSSSCGKIYQYLRTFTHGTPEGANCAFFGEVLFVFSRKNIVSYLKIKQMMTKLRYVLRYSTYEVILPQ